MPPKLNKTEWKCMKKLLMNAIMLIATLSLTTSMHATHNQPWYARLMYNSTSTLKTIYSAVRENSFVKKYETQLVVAATATVGIGAGLWLSYKYSNKTAKKKSLKTILPFSEDQQNIANLLVSERILQGHQTYNTLHTQQTSSSQNNSEQIIARVDLDIMRDKAHLLHEKYKNHRLYKSL